MKKCLSCGAIFPAEKNCCTECNWHPEIQEGFPLYAPQQAQSGGGFKSTYFADIEQLEDRHFWFRVRNRLIIWSLKKYCAGFRNFLEIGCGTGFVLSGIRTAFPDSTLYGSEIFITGLHFASAKQPTVNFMQMDARNIPYENEFDVIGAFDVLEHIEEDTLVLAQMYDALRPGGHVLITVPQHGWLWSYADDYACHVRRYSAQELHNKITSAGFEIVRSTSFVFSLLPVMWASRSIQRKRLKNDATAELKIANWLNYLLGMILNIEVLLIRFGMNFVFGGSRLVAARKL